MELVIRIDLPRVVLYLYLSGMGFTLFIGVGTFI